MKPTHDKPLALTLLAASALLIATLALFSHSSGAADADKPAAPGKAALTVTLTQAKAGSLPIRLAANGNVAAWQEASVGAEAAGLRVQELLVNVGDSVQRGQRLASFAPESVQADVALARAALSEAQANATQAKADADRARAVQDSGALSAQQISQYLTQELAAQARIASAQAQLDAQLLRLKHTEVLAPDAGIITSRSATLGAVLGQGSEMFRLIRQGRLEWRAELTSSELGRISADTSVLVTAPGGAQVTGRVRVVAPTVDAQTRNGLVYVDLPSPSADAPSAAGSKSATGSKGAAAAFKPGMFARGEFALGQSNALTVLQSAVLVREGFSYVMRVAPDNRVSQRKVQTGRVLGEQVEIVAGLTPDDRLVASGASFLSEGDLVRVVAGQNLGFKENQPVAPVPSAQAATK